MLSARNDDWTQGTNLRREEDGKRLTDSNLLWRAVVIITRYLDSFNDANVAISSLDTLLKAAHNLNNHQISRVRQKLLLRAILEALDVLRNHCQPIPMPMQASLTELIRNLSSGLYGQLDLMAVDLAFWLKLVQCAQSYSADTAQQSDIFGGLVYDIGSILLSRFKYDVHRTFFLPLISRFFKPSTIYQIPVLISTLAGT